jgi:hypothetical protein
MHSSSIVAKTKFEVIKVLLGLWFLHINFGGFEPSEENIL